MKKAIKRITVAAVVLMALIGATGTVALASGYITWNGTQDFQQTLINLDLISERGQELKTSNQTLTENNQTLTASNEDLESSNETLEASNKELKSSNETLTTNNENINRELEQTRNQLLDKDNKIDSLEQDIKALEKRINDGQTTQDQLKQAEKDMKNVREKSQEVLNVFN